MDFNPGLFCDEENTRDFALTVSQRTKMIDMSMCLNSCQIPGHAMAVLLLAFAVNKKKWLSTLGVYNRDRLQGQDRARLLQIISKTHATGLTVNLDFTDPALLSAFHKNTSIVRLFTYNYGLHLTEAITNGLVFGILRRTVAGFDERPRRLKLIDADAWESLHQGEVTQIAL
jgi:hypothetical protein